ncbi:ABC transporter substrate-binding protein [Camelimonas lactis]|uniref:Branched-chain amino acid transport system substrate-binding protein n=1 Tax=Camelimonas lactis TaxID=659006 RepID=A0A4R2GKM7_9HYPH|nr:ABC transporter substrate-binding protein [Camelimonas lactis]TCO09411.1 branched-chain amino acid transport system substrate-binding protein [Camelimonas lactis]
MKFVLPGAATATALALVLGCNGAQAADDLVLGFLTARSGPYVSLSNTNEAAVRMAVDEVNKAGGVNGKQIRIVTFDTAGDPKQAATGVRQFANDNGALAVIGPFSSSEVRTAFPVGERSGIAVMSNSSSAPGLTKGFSYAFRNTVDEGKAIDAVMASLRDKKLPMATGAVAYATDDTVSKSVGAKVAPELFKTYGVELKGSVDFQFAAFDLSPQVSRLKGMAPDVIGIGAPPEGAINLSREMKRQGLKARVIGGTTIADPELPKRMEGAGEGLTIGTTFFHDVNDRTRAFTKEFGERTRAAGLNRHEPNQMDASAYDIVLIYAEAMKRANVSGDKAGLEKERTAIRDQVTALKKFPALEGEISFVNGDSVKPIYVLEVKGDAWSLFDTRKPE